MRGPKSIKIAFVAIAMLMLFFGCLLSALYFCSDNFSHSIYTIVQPLANPNFHKICEGVYAEDELSEAQEKKIVEYFEKMSPRMYLYENDYIIILTNRVLSSDAPYAEGNFISGTTNRAEKVITIRYEFLEFALMHEIGHAVDNTGFYTSTQEFQDFYDKADETSVYDEYYISDIREYFAYNYSLFTKGQLTDVELYKYFCKITDTPCFIIGG